MTRNAEHDLIEYGNRLHAAGLVTGSGGNLSARLSDNRFLVTPSGIAYADLVPEDLVVMDGEGTILEGTRKPSSEAGFHLAIYGKRPEVSAIIHTHSVAATTVACMGWELPAIHYLVGFAGKKVPIAPYATFGSPELAAHVAETIGDYGAVLLEHHGLVAVGDSLEDAFNVAEEIEFVAEIYLRARSVGEPRIIGEAEMEKVVAKFADYRKRGKKR